MDEDTLYNCYKMIKDTLYAYRTSNEELCEMYNLEEKEIYPFMTGYLGTTLEYLEGRFEEWRESKK